MKAYNELAQFHPSGPTLVTIGVFDGVHRGHQYLLNQLKAEAASRGCGTAVVTFRAHPRTVLRPGNHVPLLTLLEDRLCLLQEQEVDTLVPLTFDLDLSHLRANEFVALLQKHLLMEGLVVGPDFALGHKREGTIPVLTALGDQMGFTVTAMDTMQLDGRPVRSTAIREAVASGDVGTAATLLSRPFTLPGHVQRGDGRGKDLGFPTANLNVHPSLAMPPDGIYATWLQIDGVRHSSATSIGVRPTFGGGQRVIETNVLDFDGDLYDKDVCLSFASRIRDELRFHTADELVAQMHQDVREARDRLTQAGWMLSDTMQPS